MQGARVADESAARVNPPRTSEVQEKNRAAPAPGSARIPRLDDVSILVVDDDPDACQALQNLLRSLGATVTIANSTREALARLDAVPVDAVVSDIGMPVEDGHVLARRIRERERDLHGARRMPLIALTAYGRVDDKVEVMTAGFDRHAVKPVDPLELVTMLKTLMSDRTAG
jgi:CheY-like chemotaxis protein